MKTREVFGCDHPVARLQGCSRSLVDDSVLIGIEVETEDSKLDILKANKDLYYWRVETDGSLKSHFPYEFILKEPVQGATLEAAILELDTYLSQTEVKYPHNTSLHVHVDVSDLDTEQLRSFVYLAVSLESALIKISGNRRNNIFCMPFGGSDGILLSELGKSLDAFKPSPDYDWVEFGKYSTVNFACVRTLGTVEFRTHVGTHKQPEITKWLNVLLALRKYAVESVTRGLALNVLDYVTSKRTLRDFLLDIWPGSIVAEMLHRELHQDVCRGAFITRLALFPKSYDEFYSWLEPNRIQQKPIKAYGGKKYTLSAEALHALHEQITGHVPVPTQPGPSDDLHGLFGGTLNVTETGTAIQEQSEDNDEF